MEINNFNLKKEATINVTPYYYSENDEQLEEDADLDMIHHVGTFYDEEAGEFKLSRAYFSFQIPDIPKNAEIVSAVLHLREHSAEVSSGETSCFTIYDEPSGFGNNFNAFKEYNSSPISFYTFSDTSIYRNTCDWFIDIDITKYIKQKAENGISRCYFIAKLENENSQDEISFCRGTATTISISYNTSYNYNTENDAITHEIGNLGRASIDVKTGNLRFCLNDFSYNGLRMPVQINHLYNSALCNERYTANNINPYLPDFSAMNLGFGFKLDLMEGSNGEKTYDNCSCTYDSETRLIKITDENGNHTDIIYSNGRIVKVTDGAGREFVLGYDNNGYLMSITAPDMTQVNYTYTNGLLTEINYPSGNNTLKISYNNDKLPISFTIVDSNNTNVYKIDYTYLRNKVSSVREYGYENGTWVAGAESTISYYPAEDRTIIESTEQTDSGAESKIITVYAGNGKYVYTKDTGSDSVTLGSGINPYMGDGGAGLICVVDNILINPGLDPNIIPPTNDNDFNGWNIDLGNETGENSEAPTYEEEHVKYGKSAVKLLSTNNAVIGKGIYQTTPTLPAGEYTFSAYCMIYNEYSGADGINPGAYLRVTDANGNILAETEHLNKADGEYIRLVAPFKIVNEQAVTVHILSDGQGVAFADAAQLERNVYANVYNMISNSNFENGRSNWNLDQDADINLGTCFNMEHSLKIEGNIHEKRNAYQDLGYAVKYAEGTRESFTLSGWAKCENGIICGSSVEGMESRFGLRAVIEYTDGTSEEYTAPFSPITNEWHRSEISFAKQEFKLVNTIKIYCDFDHSSGTAYFDDIMLVQDYVEYGLTAEDFEDQSEDTSNSTDDDDSEEQWPTLEDGMVPFYEVYDEYGNQRTSMNFCRTLDNPEVPSVIYREYTYSADGNNLIGESDERGRFTTYTVDANNSRITEKTYRDGTKAAYEYDSAGKTTKVTAKKANGTEVANVSYGYDALGNMDRITRGDGMRYDIEYNPFGDIKTIGINGKSEALVSYTYKEKNGRLKEIGYANGDKAKLFYNSAGSLIAERWCNINNEDIAHYKYVYDSEGNIIRSVDILGEKEYTYLYGDNGISCVTEYDITVSGENITSRQLKNKIRNFYNEDGKLIKKRINDRDIFYNHTDNEDSSTSSTATDGNVTATIIKDGLGRKDTESVTIGDVTAGRWFEYEEGRQPNAYNEDYLPEAYITSNIVSRMYIYADGIYRYIYDSEDRITKVTGPDTITNYTYDSQGQLLTEKRGNTTLNTMTYDAYGNILTKNGKAYVYDTVWKDLLLSYGGQAITYDAQGNPTNYLGHTLTWEKGRQLKSFDSNTYTYNANGIRTSKTVGGVKHEYVLEGSKILKETWGNNTLVPIYDAENSVVGIKYNDVPYLFQRNLQNDIVGIVDSTGVAVVKYSYDAWGVCTVTSDTSGINLSAINPYRYRSYYYDTEIGLYYLQSRYYDPVVSRFICGDEPVFLCTSWNITSYNLFTYCLNSPVNMTDNTGYLPFFVVTGIAFALIGGVIGYVATGSLEGTLTGATIGGAIGLTGGIITAKLLTGSAIAKASAVIVSGNAILGTTTATILSQADKISQKVGSIYRALTWHNFRYNFQKLTGDLGIGKQAHHILPVKFEIEFLKAGINIHNPLYGAWVDPNSHQKWSSAYNKAWEIFFKSIHNPTPQQIFNKAIDLAKQYGYKLNF